MRAYPCALVRVLEQRRVAEADEIRQAMEAGS
jgi:hypothetical protein